MPIEKGKNKQICNAGFVIPPAHRRFGYGKILGKSYLHYGPLLGYKASVFNLVYANNTGSLRYVRALRYSTIDGVQMRLLVEFGTRWASPVRVSFHELDVYDARMGTEKNGLMLWFITEASWARKNGHAR